MEQQNRWDQYVNFAIPRGFPIKGVGLLLLGIAMLKPLRTGALEPITSPAVEYGWGMIGITLVMAGFHQILAYLQQRDRGA